MSDDFIDSNVFVYLFDENDQGKRRAAQILIHAALANGSAQISFQVVQETLNVITGKLVTPVTQEDARQFLDRILSPLWKINPSRALYQRGLDMQARYRFSFYDSLIIAAALESGCKTLYSEDLQHGQVIERLTIENPFRD
jgi:predicted nucleic acid-binding protein